MSAEGTVEIRSKLSALVEALSHNDCACECCRDDETPYLESGGAVALPDIEITAAKVHEAWMDAKRAQGVESRPSEWGEEQMVPYADLSERAKELDRSTVRAVYDAIEATT